MYCMKFGFKERPFKLVPDPEYLFLSKSHQEAIAHLNYAISNGDGFVKITGEVGTGKTTLCRVFIESVKDKLDIEVAYIFNPMLNSVELLQLINEEFSIKSDLNNTKDLINILNKFLIKKKEVGSKVILLIDEAQNLSFEVLEQIRLLSNLETKNQKLIEIILLGQPEFDNILKSYKLRQLNQRITLHRKIHPLTFKETVYYIQHRLYIASNHNLVDFNRKAFRKIFKYSRGVPRLINKICDRALLTAFNLDKNIIDASIIHCAISEFDGDNNTKFFYFIKKNYVSVVIVSFIAILFVFLIYSFLEENIKKSTPAKFIFTQINRLYSVDDNLSKKTIKVSFYDYLNSINLKDTRYNAFKEAASLWKTDFKITPFMKNFNKDIFFFNYAAKHNGLNMINIQCDINTINELNIPVILQLFFKGISTPGYFTLITVNLNDVIIKTENQLFKLSKKQLNGFWSKKVYIPWKNSLLNKDFDLKTLSSETVIKVKEKLNSLKYNEKSTIFDFDNNTHDLIKKVQKKYAFKQKNTLKLISLILLLNESLGHSVPRLGKSFKYYMD